MFKIYSDSNADIGVIFDSDTDDGCESVKQPAEFSAANAKPRVQCAFCLKRYLSNELDNHMKLCDFRYEICPDGCGAKIMFLKMQQHRDICSGKAGSFQVSNASVDNVAQGGCSVSSEHGGGTVKITVHFLMENADHEIAASPGLTVLQFKELLRQQIPFLRQFPCIPLDVLKLSLEGFEGRNESGELTGSVMEDCRQLSWYPLTEERHPVLLALERPMEKILCFRCNRPFAQWSGDRLCCDDQESLERRRARIPQLLNCGHSVCLECLREGLVVAEEAIAEEKEFVSVDPALPRKEAEEEQNREAAEREAEGGRRRLEREKAENMFKFVCPVGCGMVSYWRRDQDWPDHESMQRMVHLKRREWVEGEKAKRRCFIRNCGAEALFRCPDCGDAKYCVVHFQRMHQFEDTSEHEPSVLLSSRIHPLASDIFKTRFCCYCGGGESATCGRGGGRPHCGHRDSKLASIRSTTKSDVIGQLTILGNLQADCWRQLDSWNDVMDELQTLRVSGVERIRQAFDDFIVKLETRKEEMVQELRYCYREKELKVLENMVELGKLSGELEAGLLHYRQSLSAATTRNVNLENDIWSAGEREDPVEEICVVREVVDLTALKSNVFHMTSSQKNLAMFGEVSMAFKIAESQRFMGEFCKIFREQLLPRQLSPAARIDNSFEPQMNLLEPENSADASDASSVPEIAAFEEVGEVEEVGASESDVVSEVESDHASEAEDRYESAWDTNSTSSSQGAKVCPNRPTTPGSVATNETMSARDRLRLRLNRKLEPASLVTESISVQPQNQSRHEFHSFPLPPLPSLALSCVKSPGSSLPPPPPHVSPPPPPQLPMRPISATKSAQCIFCLKRYDSREIDDHKKSCDLRSEICPNGCGARIMFLQRKKHEDSCPNRFVDLDEYFEGPSPVPPARKTAAAAVDSLDELLAIGAPGNPSSS